MEPQAILDHLAHAEGLPEAAIRAAREQRDVLAPAFVDLVERHGAGDASARELDDALFFVFHLLGEWRETSAYRPLARLLAGPPDQVQRWLGEGSTETSHRVMAAVFDGDPAPLQQVIEAEDADEFVRSRMFDALAMVTLTGDLDRDEVKTYLRDSFATLRPHAENFVWVGWQSAIALLGLDELRSLVEKAFARGLIGPYVMDLKDFKSDLRHALAHPQAPWRSESEKDFSLFGDTIEELSSWYGFSPEYRERKSPDRERKATDSAGFGLTEPRINPLRGIGRNDPCPCGSGKKFKRCCLT